MRTAYLGISFGTALVAALVAWTGWYHVQQVLRDSQSQLGVATLIPVAALLKDDDAITKELRAAPFAEPDLGILGSYLAQIRRDGVAKHAQMKQRLDTLAENNAAIVALIEAYQPYSKTPVFTAQAEKFRTYAAAWRDRWNSAMELFMAGGNYPVSEVPFPRGFPAAVQEELALAH